MSDEKTGPEGSASQPYEPPVAEDLDTSDGPPATAAGATGVDTG
jgi:hypothetical protein